VDISLAPQRPVLIQVFGFHSALIKRICGLESHHVRTILRLLVLLCGWWRRQIELFKGGFLGAAQFFNIETFDQLVENLEPIHFCI
jgi:hypothetical protein